MNSKRIDLQLWNACRDWWRECDQQRQAHFTFFTSSGAFFNLAFNSALTKGVSHVADSLANAHANFRCDL